MRRSAAFRAGWRPLPDGTLSASKTADPLIYAAHSLISCVVKLCRMNLMRIEQRFNRWLTFMDVPKDVRSILGKNRFVASLKTGDKTLARQRAAQLEQEWRALIAQARARVQGADPI